MKNTLLTTTLLLLLASIACTNTSKQQNQTKETKALEQSQQAFYNNLKSLCGKSFKGYETYTKEGRDSWADRELVIYFTICEPNEIHIPLHVNEDQSRTWMFINENGDLRFRHHHRHEDGTPEEITLYGGYAKNGGTPYKQVFPADDYTNNLLDDELERFWIVSLSEGLSSMSYELGYHGEVVFRAEFDLTNPL